MTFNGGTNYGYPYESYSYPYTVYHQFTYPQVQVTQKWINEINVILKISLIFLTFYTILIFLTFI